MSRREIHALAAWRIVNIGLILGPGRGQSSDEKILERIAQVERTPGRGQSADEKILERIAQVERTPEKGLALLMSLLSGSMERGRVGQIINTSY